MNDDDLLTRGIANVIPSLDLLKKELESGKKLNIYLGIDPTAVNIHLGHAVVLRKLQKFADMGHNVTFLVGDFTALIGDTSDKESERPQISSEQISQNLETYKEQAAKILDFSKIEIKFNSEWLSELKFADIVKLTQRFTLGDFISRELIKKRLNSGTKIGLHEVLYPVMQGYDSYHLNTDIQLGGTDQTFNMQAGRSLLKDINNKESFVVTTSFLSGTDGRKMSKTWGNAIWLTDTADDMFGKIMSLKDDLIMEYFLLATDVPTEKIKEMKKRIDDNENPIGIKKELAKEIVKMFHGSEKADIAEANFKSVVQDKEIPTDIPTLTFKNGETVGGTVVNSGLASSMSEWKRLVEQGGVSIDGVRVENPFMKNSELPETGILKIGKRNYATINKI
jgi:tyrosyl-tRNA synthetase